MSTQPKDIARRLIFYVQLSKHPELLASHVAEVVCAELRLDRKKMLVAVDWALSHAELAALFRQPHDDAVLRRFFEAIAAALMDEQLSAPFGSTRG